MLLTLFFLSLFGQVSDDFNSPTLNPIWRALTPAGGSYDLQGAGSGQAYLQLSVPAGSSHDIWHTGDLSAKLLQPISSNEFEVEACFLTVPFAINTGNGIIIRESDTRFLRFDLVYLSNGLRLFGASIYDGSGIVRCNVAAPGQIKSYLRIARSANTWTLKSSIDGVIWDTTASFAFQFNPSETGVYALNAGGSTAPAYTSQVDWFFNCASPISPEDGPVSPPPPPPLITSIILYWDPVTKDINDNPETIAGYEISILDSNNIPVEGAMLATGPTGWQGTEIISIINMSSSPICYVRVRANDEAGNISDWSQCLPIAVPIDSYAPCSPINLRIEAR